MPEDDATDLITSQEALAGILALLAAAREDSQTDGPTQRKTEVLLADAGVSIKSIARVLGKNEPAVRMAVRRARERAIGG